MTLSDYGDSVMPLALRGLEAKTLDPYLAGWRKRVVPSLGHVPVRMVTNGAVDRAVHAWIADEASRSNTRLFTGPRGGRITTAVLRDATHWDEVVTELGCDHLRRDDLRHTGLTWLADAGVPVHVLRKIAGHGSLTTTQRYLHPDTGSLTAAGDALSSHAPSNGPQMVPNCGSSRSTSAMAVDHNHAF
jgi:site-specific recombinase XerD